MNTVDRTRCPICHEPNVCAMEKAKKLAASLSAAGAWMQFLPLL